MTRSQTFQHISAFDLDRTLFIQNSAFSFGQYLYRQKHFSTPRFVGMLLAYVLHAMGFISIHKIHEIAFWLLFSRKNESQVKQLVEEFLAGDFAAKLYAPAIQKLREAQAAGHLTIILSSSPDFIVAAIAKRLGVSLWQATKYALDREACFCHIQYVLDGAGKAVILEQLSQRCALTRSDITAYSDSVLDLPFLLTAGTAVGVNPDRKLREISKQRRWQII